MALELGTEFTMSEYIEFHKLGVSPNDRAATAIIAQHLYKKGYAKVRKRHFGKVCSVWTKDKPHMDELKQKLKDL